MRSAAVFALLACLSNALQVTIRNDIPRVDVDGNIIDCHSGNIVLVNGTFYMVGEHYGNTTGFGPSPPAIYPKIVTYTSPDMMTWTFRGFALDDWPTKPYGTFFTPWVIYDAVLQRFVMYFNAYLNGCCDGNWGVAVSSNGVNYTLLSLNASGAYAIVDGNALFVDPDTGTGYLQYTSEAQDHHVSIELLSPDFTTLAGTNYGLFPDRYVEGAILFKRGSTYYTMYGSCCCFCRGGSGAVVYRASSISGPWTRQPLDVNCNSTQPGDICGAYGDRVTGGITVSAQGIGLSLIPLTDGTTAYLWHGERWLSAANNPPNCPDECQPSTGQCADPPGYIKGNGYSYWTALSFDAQGNVLPFAPFVNSFTLDVDTSRNSYEAPRQSQVESGEPALFESL